MLPLIWYFFTKWKSDIGRAQVCSLGTCVWEWQGAWLLSLQLDQHAGWGVGESGDWIQRLQAPALPLISPPHLTWPLCCCSTEPQLGHKDTHTHTYIHIGSSASLSRSYLPSDLSVFLLVCVPISLSVSDWLFLFLICFFGALCFLCVLKAA